MQLAVFKQILRGEVGLLLPSRHFPPEVLRTPNPPTQGLPLHRGPNQASPRGMRAPPRGSRFRGLKQQAKIHFAVGGSDRQGHRKVGQNGERGRKEAVGVLITG